MNYFSLLQDKRMFSSLRLVKEIPILVFFLKCVSVYFFRYFYVCVGVCVWWGGGGDLTRVEYGEQEAIKEMIFFSFA